jgi:hypothetical protein
MNDSGVIFEGSGPFHLPAAQRATATAHGNDGVTMTVYCLLPKREKGGAGISRYGTGSREHSNVELGCSRTWNAAAASG